MNQHLEDAFLYRYIPEAEAAMLAAIPPEAELRHSFSRRFRRKMEALLRYERRSGFGRFAAGFGRIAAAVLIALLAVNTVLVCSVEAYRESFYEIVETVTEKFTAFFVKVDENAPVTEFIPIDPPYIPEGFEVVEQITSDVENTIFYLNDDGKDIFFSQMTQGIAPIYFDTEGASIENKIISGYEVRVISENEITQIYCVVDGHEFVVTGTAGYEEILKITENILKFFEK